MLRTSRSGIDEGPDNTSGTHCTELKGFTSRDRKGLGSVDSLSVSVWSVGLSLSPAVGGVAPRWQAGGERATRVTTQDTQHSTVSTFTHRSPAGSSVNAVIKIDE